MNHALNLYTALFFAIPFLTVSIWSGDIRNATGKTLVLLAYIATLALKVAIDDYIHFVSIDRTTAAGKAKLQRSLQFSLVTYILFASATANAALGKSMVAELLLIATMLLGLWWMLGDKVPSTNVDAQLRRLGWKLMNILTIAILIIDLLLMRTGHGTSTTLLLLLVGMVVVDAVIYGTFERLADLD